MEKLASALEQARQQAEINKCQVIHSSQLERPVRELLTRNGWLEVLIRGWYLLVRPDVQPGDTTPWYSNFWDFLRLYLEHRYGKDYILSAESSLLLHTSCSIIPQQVVVIISKGGAGLVPLPFDTSIYSYVDRSPLPVEQEVISGLNVMTLPLSLCRVGPSFFTSSEEDARLALSLVESAESLAQPLLKYQAISAGNRLVGALKAVGREETSTALEKILLKSGSRVEAENPFTTTPAPVQRHRSPYYSRIQTGWAAYRKTIIDLFQGYELTKLSTEQYLTTAIELHQDDAYHSLSIEGYQVTTELIAQVESGDWDAEKSVKMADQRNTLAARGYYEAFLAVQESTKAVLSGKSPGKIARRDLSDWYQSLWSPCVKARLIPYANTLGYRNGPVYIRGSKHVPPPKEALTDAMDALFTCLEEEESAVVRAILGHYFFVYIHPYPDGNGRTARFLMNLQLAADRIPWCVIKTESRNKYFAALEIARVDEDITEFARFIRDTLISK